MLRSSIVKAISITIGLAMMGYCFADSNEAGEEYTTASTLNPDLENGKEVYEICASCHLQEGWGLKDGTYPQIAGQHRAVLIRQLSDIHAQNRDNPTMYPFALPEAIGDAQAVADVAGYMERMKMTRDNGKGDWTEGSSQFVMGKKLFSDNCVECHGENGEGDTEKLFPKIQGQHYNYMLRQLEWMRDGRRRNVEHKMLDNINKLTEAEMAYVVNYVSRIPVPEKDLAP